MPATYTLIASNTLSSSAASVTFSAIPNTYTDLVVRFNGKSSGALNTYLGYFTLNSTGSNLYSVTRINALNGSFAVTSDRASNANEIANLIFIGDASGTGNVFTPGEIYIPNYTAANNKPTSSITFAEQNNTTGYDWTQVGAGLWRSSNAITSISIFPGGGTSFQTGSSFFLYGIKNS